MTHPIPTRVISSRSLLEERLLCRRYPSAEAEMVAHALGWRATVTDRDALEATVDACALDLANITCLDQDTIYRAMEQLVVEGFAVDAGTVPGGVRYHLHVRALPARVGAESPATELQP